MKKIFLSLLFLGVLLCANSYARTNANNFFQDTVQVSLEDLEAEDSVSIDDMEPIFYEAEEEEDAMAMEAEEKSNLLLYVVMGIVVVGGGIIFYSRSKKK